MDGLINVIENGVTVATAKGEIVQIDAPAAYYSQLQRWLKDRAEIMRALGHSQSSSTPADPAAASMAAMFSKTPRTPDLDHPALKPSEDD